MYVCVWGGGLVLPPASPSLQAGGAVVVGGGDPGRAPLPWGRAAGAGRALPRRLELRRRVCVWREGGRAARPQVAVPGGPSGERTWQRRSREEGFLPPEPGLTLLLPPPDASPGDSLFISRSGLSTRPPSFPHPLPGIFSPPGDYQVSRPSLSGILRLPPPPRGLSPPFSAGLSPRFAAPLPRLPGYAPPQPRLSGIICFPFGVIPPLLISAPAFPCLFSSRGSHPSPSVCL